MAAGIVTIVAIKILVQKDTTVLAKKHKPIQNKLNKTTNTTNSKAQTGIRWNSKTILKRFFFFFFMLLWMVRISQQSDSEKRLWGHYLKQI